jgi:hypothetical protein
MNPISTPRAQADQNDPKPIDLQLAAECVADCTFRRGKVRIKLIAKRLRSFRNCKIAFSIST